MLRRILRDVPDLAVIDPLPPLTALADEGAANHSRLAAGAHGRPGVHLFVHGRAEGLPSEQLPTRFPARQSREACAAVARLLALPTPRVLHARQDPRAIDAGAFHNDVVMVADRDRVLLHEHAVVDQDRVLAQLRVLVPGLRAHMVADADLPLADAVRSYLFNSQLLATTEGTVLVTPAQAGEGAAGRVVRRLLDEGLIARALHLDLGESMANGGGPACLRLRVPLSAAQLAGVAPGVVLDVAKIAALEAWVDRHYREELSAEDLADPALLDEGRGALDELTALLGLGALYRFQGGPC
jgi:succinylarginine dihydrolase